MRRSRVSKKEKAAAMSRLAKELGGMVKKNKITGIHQGKDFEIRFIEAEVLTPPRMRIRLSGHFAEPFTIRLENRFDRIAKKARIVRELQTGDAGFDERYFIEFGNRRFLESFLKGKNLGIINSIFSAGVATFSLRKKRCELVLDDRAVSGIEPEAVSDLLGNLDELTKEIPAARSDTAKTGKHPSTQTILGFIYGFALVLYASGIGLGIYGLKKYYPLDPWIGKALLLILPFVLIFTIIVVILLFFIFRSRSDLHRLLATAMITILIATVFTGWAVFVFTNGYLDDSVLSRHELEVFDKKTKSPLFKAVTQQSDRYYLQVNDWTMREAKRWIRVKHKFYKEATPGRKISMVTGRGYRGIEWRESYQFMK